MPTYKNNTDHPVYWGSRSWASGEEKPVSFFIPTEAGLTKTSDDPVPDSPILYSEDIVLVAGIPQEIEIPYPRGGKYSLSVVAVDGSATLSLGGKDITIDIKAEYNGVLCWGQIPLVTMSSAEGGYMRFLAEEESVCL